MEVLSLLIIFQIIYLSYRNGLIAKQKGKRPVVWVLLTVLSYFFFYVVGAGVVQQILISSGQINVNPEQTQTFDQVWAVSNKMTELIFGNPIHVLTILAFGLGGYLLIRYILERMPNVNIPKDNEGVV